MSRIILARLVQLCFTLLGVFAVLFAITRLSGDPVALLLGPSATTEQIALLRGAMGFDRPLWQQFLGELQGALQLDFGQSLRGGQAALPLAFTHLAVSLQLVAGALVFAVVMAVPIGVAAAVWPRSLVSRLLMAVAFLGQAVPIFFSAPLLILLLGVSWQLLPTSGWESPAHAVMPVVALGLGLMAKVARVVRAQMLEVLAQDYVRTARSKGLSLTQIVLVHALRNSMVPTVTVIGADLGQLIGSAVLTETIFAVPGLGFMLLTAALARDYPLLQAGIFLTAVFVVALNLAADLICAALDPRIRGAEARR
ncbi:ABC transporter permease [Falsiroseomonas sp. E2-1-a4]|uniref:ABC transporter permease n=1 Tax=Falsiroseomonas sp. E2-1-a4 TaxID=3239299 RepID=UPI003F3F4AFF